MDKEKLHAAVTKAIESIATRKFNFTFSWIALRNSDGNFKEPNGNQLIKALHIKVPENERDITYKILEVIFVLDSEFKILGTSMLMVPIIRDNIPIYKIDDIHHLVVKQKQFLDQLQFISHPGIQMFMRDMIMKINNTGW